MSVCMQAYCEHSVCMWDCAYALRLQEMPEKQKPLTCWLGCSCSTLNQVHWEAVKMRRRIHFQAGEERTKLQTTLVHHLQPM